MTTILDLQKLTPSEEGENPNGLVRDQWASGISIGCSTGG